MSNNRENEALQADPKDRDCDDAKSKKPDAGQQNQNQIRNQDLDEEEDGRGQIDREGQPD